ncbi:MAG: hypothetical protein ACKOTE_05940 [Opitutaceae bacterium]
MRPELPGDPRHRIAEPSVEQITAALESVGLRGEAALFSSVLVEACAGRLSSKASDLDA